MGIFSDTCEALIDSSTGKALSGDALAKAKDDPKWPRCNNKVRKAARFCNACGSPAPGGWWKCPSCHKWIGNEAQFCSHCNTPLFPDDRAVMAGGVWRKDQGVFAQRFEIGDIERLVQHELLIQEGTIAVVVDGGHFHGFLESGRHNPDSLARKINWFGNPPPRSVIMMDSGDVALPLCVEGLRTSEFHPIEFYGEVILRFGNDKASAIAFLENALKDRRNLTYKDLSQELQGVVRTSVDEMCTVSSLDDLVRDPERRIRLQETMTRKIGEDLARYGLKVVRVSSAEFTGDEYEEYAERLGEIDIKRRELEYVAAMRKLNNKEEMDKYKDTIDLKSYMDIVFNEYQVSKGIRDREWELLKRSWEHDNKRHEQLLAVEKVEHEIQIQELQAAAAREKARQDEENEMAIVNGWVDVKDREKRLEQERKADDAKRRQGMSLEERIMDVSDPVVRQELLALMKAERNRTMTPEQMLAEAAIHSKDAADALAKMADKSKENAERVFAELKKVYADANERQDKNLKTLLEPVIEAAKRQAGPPQTIVH